MNNIENFQISNGPALVSRAATQSRGEMQLNPPQQERAQSRSSSSSSSHNTVNNTGNFENSQYFGSAVFLPPRTTENKTENQGEAASTEPKAEEKKVEKVKKERSTICIVKLFECLFGIPQSLLDSITQKEANQENDDRLLTMAINKRNEVENFIYSTRSKLESDLGAHITNEEKENLLSLMRGMEDWLYSGDEEVYNKSVLETKGKDLNDLGTKIYKRYHDWTKLAESLDKLESIINLNIKKIEFFSYVEHLTLNHLKYSAK
jgi:hypothetical protein